MRIIKRQEFLKLPEGIVYSKYEPTGNIERLCYKCESTKNDWYYQDLISPAPVDVNDSGEFGEYYHKAEKDNTFNFELDLECGDRDGLYEENQMFLIYDKTDLKKLIKILIDLLVL